MFFYLCYGHQQQGHIPISRSALGTQLLTCLRFHPAPSDAALQQSNFEAAPRTDCNKMFLEQDLSHEGQVIY